MIDKELMMAAIGERAYGNAEQSLRKTEHIV
jgi:hypothetical protein